MPVPVFAFQSLFHGPLNNANVEPSGKSAADLVMSRIGSMVGQLELKWKVDISLFSARKKENADGEM